MRVIIFSILVSASYAAILNRAYLPPDSQSINGTYQGAQGPFPSGTFQGPTSFPPSQRTFQNGNFRSSPEGNAAILRFANDLSADAFQYSFETANGIKAEESGQAANGARTRGSFSYLGADGLMYRVVYSADENGFQPQGAHLPVAPPIPVEIQKALEQNARDEANGIFDDGSYNEARYGEKSSSSQSGAGFQASSGYQSAGGFKSSSGFSSGAGFQATAGSGGFQGLAPQQISSGFQSAGGFNPNSGFPGSGAFQGFSTQQKFSPQTGYRY